MRMEGMILERNDLADFQRRFECASEDLARMEFILKEREIGGLDPILGENGSSLFKEAAVFFSGFSTKQEFLEGDARELEGMGKKMLGAFEAFGAWLYNPEIRDSIDNLERLANVLGQTAENFDALALSAESMDSFAEAVSCIRQLAQCMEDAKFQISEKREAMLAI